MWNLIGSTVWARQTLESDIFYKKPDKWFKIWFFIVSRVNHTDNKHFKRGECFTTYTEIASFTGANKHIIENCIKWLKSTTTITTQKATRGMIVYVVNYARFQNAIKKKATVEATPKATQKPHRSHTINKNDKNLKNNTNVLDKSFGREDINKITKHLKEALKGSLDGTITENRKYAKLLIDRLKKDYPDFNTVKQIIFLIDKGLEDNFHAKNLTSFKYLYYNCQKIINSIKQNNKPTITVIE